MCHNPSGIKKKTRFIPGYIHQGNTVYNLIAFLNSLVSTELSDKSSYIEFGKGFSGGKDIAPCKQHIPYLNLLFVLAFNFSSDHINALHWSQRCDRGGITCRA